jgi:arylsulfatase A-like enzyme
VGPPSPPPAAISDTPSALIVVIDALRADRLGCYGYDRNTSPNMDLLAADSDGVRFTRHYAQAAWTKPSTASLFTGLYLFQHGVEKGHQKTTTQREWYYTSQVIDDRFTSVAERLQPLGVHTFAVVKTYLVAPKYGFARGFDDFEHRREARTERKRIKRTLRSIRRSEGPFFGYVHLEGVHHPFPAETRHPEIMESHGFEYDEKARAARGKDFGTGSFHRGVRDEGLVLDDDDVRFLNLVYDAEVRWVDEELIAPLIEGLTELQVYDNCLIIITADHGEELYDHGSVGHSRTLYEEVIRIPMIAKFPRGRRPAALGRKVHAITQSIDLLPSLVRFFGGKVPADVPGVDIFSGRSAGLAYAELRDKRWAVVQDTFKIIRGSTGTRLFDLENDPAERLDLASELPDQVEAMNQVVMNLRRSVVISPRKAPEIEIRLNPEVEESLRKLGYIE